MSTSAEVYYVCGMDSVCDLNLYIYCMRLFNQLRSVEARTH